MTQTQTQTHMDGSAYTFLYASRLVSRPVTEGGRRIGTAIDLVARRMTPYPELEGFVVRRKGKPYFLPLAKVSRAALEGRGAIVAHAHDLLALVQDDERFLVAQVLLDKQIVDVQGAKVERVNDVHLLTVDAHTYLVHVDVGLPGLLRRLGFEGGVRRIARTFGRDLKDDWISWRYVQTLQGRRGPGPIRLAVGHEQLHDLHPGELADILEDLDKEGRVALLHSVDPEVAASALEEVEPELGAAIVKELDPEVAADIMEEMEAAAAADILDEVTDEHREEIIERMDAEERQEIETLHTYEDKSAGALMSTDFVEIAATATVADAIAEVRKWADEVAMLHYVYLLDDTGALVGAVSLKQLILARPDTPLRELAGMRLVTVSADEDWSDVAEKFYKYNFQALPVVDENDRLVGVVSFRSSFDELVRYYVREAA